MKKILLLFLIFLSLAFLAGSVSAQNSQNDLAKEHGITFPIAELGNCGSISACEAFCDKQENQQVCINFAKSKGFYQQSQSLPPNEDRFLKLAQKELGCNSQDSCMAFCDQRGNWRKCADFAKRNGLDGGGVEQMEAAMQQLSCDSPRACMDYCSNPLNMARCMQVFKDAGFEVESSEPIEAWCPKQARGSQESCVIEGGNTCVCTDSVSTSSTPTISDKEWCEQDGGAWKDEICWFSEGGVFEPIESWCPKQGANCRIEGDSCVCTETSTDSLDSIESWCPQAGPDCRVEDNNCICGSIDGSDTSFTNNDITTIPDEPIEAWCPKQGPTCKVDGEICMCAPESSDGDNSSTYSEVQGAKTAKGLLQLILDELNNLLKQ